MDKKCDPSSGNKQQKKVETNVSSGNQFAGSIRTMPIALGPTQFGLWLISSSSKLRKLIDMKKSMIDFHNVIEIQYLPSENKISKS